MDPRERVDGHEWKFVSALNAGMALHYLVVDTRSISVQPEFESTHADPGDIAQRPSKANQSAHKVSHPVRKRTI